jgi:hypothetical protein
MAAPGDRLSLDPHGVRRRLTEAIERAGRLAELEQARADTEHGKAAESRESARTGGPTKWIYERAAVTHEDAARLHEQAAELQRIHVEHLQRVPARATLA